MRRRAGRGRKGGERVRAGRGGGTREIAGEGQGMTTRRGRGWGGWRRHDAAPRTTARQSGLVLTQGGATPDAGRMMIALQIKSK